MTKNQIPNQRIRKCLLIPLTAVLVVLLGTFVFNTYFMYKAHSDHDVQEKLRSTKSFIKANIQQTASLLGATLEVISQDKNLQIALAERNRQSLLKLSMPLFKRLLQNYEITHFYFTGSDRINILRVHQPERYGDKIDRFTTLQAEKSSKASYGLELGVLGTLTLRMVSPLYNNDQLIGYVELGREIGYTIEEISKITRLLEVEFVIAIHKSNLNKNQWEEGIQMLGRDSNWDKFPYSVIIGNSMDTIPEGIAAVLSKELHNSRNISLKIDKGKQKYRGGIIPIVDVAGNYVGDYVVLHDVTFNYINMRNHIALVSIICFSAGIILFFLFYIYFGRVENSLQTAQQNLFKEIKARETMQDKYIKELERSNQELQEFAYVASHDLQEPLRKVQTFSDRLKNKYKESLDEKGTDYLQRIQNSAVRMQTLINDLLTYSRVTTKAKPFQQVNLNKVTLDVVNDLEILIERIKGRVEVNNLATLDADEVQIRQLLQNLISNALKFHKGDVAPLVTVDGQTLEDSTIQAKSSTGLYQLTVHDNGIGFDEKYLDRIFNIFQRLHGRGVYEGTGVGLAICRKIAIRHGGDITAKSRPGEGSTFIVTLPIKQKGKEAEKL